MISGSPPGMGHTPNFPPKKVMEKTAGRPAGQRPHRCRTRVIPVREPALDAEEQARVDLFPILKISIPGFPLAERNLGGF